MLKDNDIDTNKLIIAMKKGFHSAYQKVKDPIRLPRFRGQFRLTFPKMKFDYRFTLNIRTPLLLVILVLKFEQVHFIIP